MRKLPVVMLVLFAVLAGSASAGGWLTVALSSTPDEVGPGGTWAVTMDIRQHGVTPVDQSATKPAIKVNGKWYEATYAGRDGLFTARVPLPASGKVEYSVDDGWGRTHEFPAVDLDTAGTTAAPATTTRTGTPVPSGGGDDGWLAGILAALSLIAAAAAVLWRPAQRHRRARRAAIALQSGR